MKHAWVLAALAAASIGTSASAGPPVPGARIRWSLLSEGAAPRIGVAVSASSETLVVTEEGVAASRPIPLASLRSLEISAGRPNRSAVYALGGAVAGGATAILLVHVVDGISDRVNDALLGASTKERPSRDLYAGLVGAAAGASIGAIVGTFRHGPERWRPVDGIQLGFRDQGRWFLAVKRAY